MVTSWPATSRTCFRAGMGQPYDTRDTTPGRRLSGSARAGVRLSGLVPVASVLLWGAARRRPWALVLQGEADLLPLDLGVQDLVLQVVGGELLEEDAGALVLDDLIVLGGRLHD